MRHSSWSFARSRNEAELSTPAILPDFLADHAVHPRLAGGNRHNAAFGHAAGDLEYQLGADGLPELVAVLDGDHEGAGAADHAVLIVELEIVDIHGGIGGLL